MNKTRIKFILNISFVIFSLFVIIFILFLFNNLNTSGKKVVENLDSMADAFCKTEEKSQIDLNAKCQQLTDKNCNLTSCCVLLNGEKCVAGSAKGSTFNTDKNGKSKPFDYYYWQNKCFGEKCPK
jgi:hypothetical protein